MAKVVVVGCAPSEIIAACYNTISSIIKQGHTVYAIIVSPELPEPLRSSSLQEGENVLELASIGVTQAFLVDRFDYSAISQTNADALNSYIETLKPTMVIIPSWKSPNHMRKILARTSLIACRGIGTILMYELDASNTSFNPLITFVANPSLIHYSTNNVVEKRITTSDPNEIDYTKTSRNNSILEDRDSKTSSDEWIEEKFESSRILLLEEEGLF